MKQFLAGMLVALLGLAVYACTTPGATSGAGGSPVLFKVNGHPVTAEQFFSSQAARGAVQQYVMLESMKQEAAKYGAKVEDKELNDKIADFKKQVTTGGNQSWDEFLKSSGMTEQEFVQRQRDMMLFQALQKKRVNVTDDEVKKVWDTDKTALVNEYAAKNHLPDSDKAKVTYDQVKDIARDRVEMNKVGMMQDEIMADIILNGKLEMTSIPDSAKAKTLEEEILGDQQKHAREQKEKAKNPPAAPSAGAQGGTPGGPGGAPPVRPGAQAAPPSQGGTKPPAGGSAAPPAKPGGK